MVTIMVLIPTPHLNPSGQKHRAKQWTSSALFEAEKLERVEGFGMVLSAIIWSLEPCVAESRSSVSVQALAKSHYLKRYPGRALWSLQSHKRALLWMEGFAFGKNWWEMRTIAIVQRLCFLKHFNVLPQLESSVSKITNGQYFFPPEPWEAGFFFFEVDGNWCGNH